jgi:hypothetical protein
MNIELKEIVERYLAAAGGYGKQVPLTSLGLSKEQIESLFSTFDDDYHISRFLHFACAAGADFQINGFPQTHVAIDEEIQSIL